MRKLFGVMIICSLLALPVFAARPVNLSNLVDHPIPATGVHLVKKVPASSLEDKGGNPHGTPPGQDKDKENGPSKGAATGELGATTTGSKYAIVIGICDYPGTENDICDSDGDSLHMHQALTDLYGYATSSIYLFKDTGDNSTPWPAATPTRVNIKNAVQKIEEEATSSEDEVVFFFSGHGFESDADLDDDGETEDEGIAVYNNNSSEITTIWDGELRSWFSDFKTSRISFVFDSCLAGGMDDVASSGRVVSMATEENQPAGVYSKKSEDVDGDGTKDGEGVFTHYFVNEGMLKGLADKYDHDGDEETGEPEDVVVEEAFDYAKDNIKGRQKPQIDDKFTDDLLW